MFRHAIREVFEMRLTLSVVATGVLVVGCDGAGEKKMSWQDGILDLENGDPVFSFMFIDTPPDGTIVRADVFEEKIGSPCELFRPDANLDGETPFWYLSIEAGSNEPGKYEIVPFFNASLDRDQAGIVLRYVENTRSAKRYPAVGGTVELVEAPMDSDEWHDGVELTAIINVEFPEQVMNTQACHGAVTSDGFVGGTCDCEAPDGTVTTCELEDASQQTCCIDLDGVRISFSTEISAKPCPWACSWSAGQSILAQYCHELH
jgi:hypothetical protein